MKKFLVASLTTVCLLLAGPSQASAQTNLVAGNVWQVNEQGVYIQNSNGVTFLPGYEASFYLNGRPVDYRYLGVGQSVNAYANRVIQQGTVSNGGLQGYQPTYQGYRGNRYSRNDRNRRSQNRGARRGQVYCR